MLVAGHPYGHEILHSHALGGYDERGGGAGLLGRSMNWATTSCNTNDLNLTLKVAAAARQRKIKGSSSKSTSERVSKSYVTARLNNHRQA
jgi:hypothetical protein